MTEKEKRGATFIAVVIIILLLYYFRNKILGLLPESVAQEIVELGGEAGISFDVPGITVPEIVANIPGFSYTPAPFPAITYQGGNIPGIQKGCSFCANYETVNIPIGTPAPAPAPVEPAQVFASYSRSYSSSSGTMYGAPPVSAPSYNNITAGRFF